MFWLLTITGLVVAYALFLRPVLKALPALKAFYAQADGFWAKVSAIGGHSATIAWGYILGGIGSCVALIEPLANLLGAPDFKTQVATALADHPEYMGYFTIAVSVVTIAARLRSIGKGV